MFAKLFSVLSAAVSGSDAAGALDFKFEPDNFLQAIPTIVTFTLSIFVVMAVIIIITALLNLVTSGKKKGDSDNA